MNQCSQEQSRFSGSFTGDSYKDMTRSTKQDKDQNNCLIEYNGVSSQWKNVITEQKAPY